MSSPQQTTDKPLTPRHAWQPLTPRGVAAFAFATLTRIVLVQIIVAVLVALTLIWFLRVVWFPVITEATRQLPAMASIRRAVLIYPGESPARLAENAHLAIVVDLESSRTAATSSDLEIVFETNRVAFCGALGCRWQPYPGGFTFTLDRAVVEPAWGAWQWPILIAAALAVGLAIFISWWVLSLCYLPFVKIVIFFADRHATRRGAWRMSAAGLLPGALMVAGGLFLYGFGVIDLLRFGLIYVLHMVAGLVFVFTSPFFLPKIYRGRPKVNPFSPPPDESPGKKSGSAPNPFAGGG